jgi:hypothetical protein
MPEAKKQKSVIDPFKQDVMLQADFRSPHKASQHSSAGAADARDSEQDKMDAALDAMLPNGDEAQDDFLLDPFGELFNGDYQPNEGLDAQAVQLPSLPADPQMGQGVDLDPLALQGSDQFAPGHALALPSTQLDGSIVGEGLGAANDQGAVSMPVTIGEEQGQSAASMPVTIGEEQNQSAASMPGDIGEEQNLSAASMSVGMGEGHDQGAVSLSGGMGEGHDQGAVSLSGGMGEGHDQGAVSMSVDMGEEQNQGAVSMSGDIGEEQGQGAVTMAGDMGEEQGQGAVTMSGGIGEGHDQGPATYPDAGHDSIGAAQEPGPGDMGDGHDQDAFSSGADLDVIIGEGRDQVAGASNGGHDPRDDQLQGAVLHADASYDGDAGIGEQHQAPVSHEEASPDDIGAAHDQGATSPPAAGHDANIGEVQVQDADADAGQDVGEGHGEGAVSFQSNDDGHDALTADKNGVHDMGHSAVSRHDDSRAPSGMPDYDSSSDGGDDPPPASLAHVDREGPGQEVTSARAVMEAEAEAAIPRDEAGVPAEGEESDITAQTLPPAGDSS